MDTLQRQTDLIDEITGRLPEFVAACKGDTDVVMLHQDAFALDYQEDEYLLLGKAIKFAGLCGKEVRVVGKKRATLNEPHPS